MLLHRLFAYKLVLLNFFLGHVKPNANSNYATTLNVREQIERFAVESDDLVNVMESLARCLHAIK